MFVPCRTLLDSWTVHAYIHWNWLKREASLLSSMIFIQLLVGVLEILKSLEIYIVINFRAREISIQEKKWCIKPFIYPSNDTPIHLLISRMIFWVKLKQAWLASYTFDSLLFVSFYLYVVFCIY